MNELKKLDLTNFDSQLETYSLKAFRQQLNCLAANVNRLVDAVNSLNENEKTEIKTCGTCDYFDYEVDWCVKHQTCYTMNSPSCPDYKEQPNDIPEEPKLLPCPFCGGEAEIDTLGYPCVRCTKCGAKGITVVAEASYARRRAIDIWNTRYDNR